MSDNTLRGLVNEWREEAQNHGLMTNDPEAKEAYKKCANDLERAIDEEQE